MKKSSTPVVVVTGGSRGIGQAVCQKFLREGWSVAACAKNVEAKGFVSLPLPDSAHPHQKHLLHQCDVGSKAQVKAFVTATLAAFGRVDVLVNNAGLAGDNPMSAEDDDVIWGEILNTNLNGTYYMCKEIWEKLPQDGTGRIINISSILGLRGVPDQPAYCAAKHGVIGLTRSLAQLFASRRITVNAICPGWVNTDMGRSRMQALGFDAERIARDVPLGKAIEPDEIASLAWFLTTSAAKNITGQCQVIDGGILN